MLLTVNVTSGAAWCSDGFVFWWMENYRTRFIRNNRVKKISRSQIPSSKEPHLAHEP